MTEPPERDNMSSSAPSFRAGASSAPSYEPSEFRFTGLSYLRDRIPQIVLALACMLAVFAGAFMQGVSFQGSLLLALVVGTLAALALAMAFASKRRFYRQMDELAFGLQDACIASSLLEEPSFAEGQAAFEAIQALSRTADRQITMTEKDARDYRSYIEAWVHEVKTPIAASKLVLAGMHGEDADKLALEVERIESQVESALFYARSSFLSNDYAISKIDLADVCKDACKRNSRFLISVGCIPRVDIPSGTIVLADRQWVIFMISQIVVNSAKYGATQVAFTSKVEEARTPRERTVLQIADNGCGIPASDVASVFEMGFVGANGRSNGAKATGLGLYLVAKLAEAMGVGVAIASEEGVGTRVMLEFPHDMRRQDTMHDMVVT